MAPCIELSKELVIECYALSRQAERSIDRALHVPWPTVVTYYAENRVYILGRVIHRLRELVPRSSEITDQERTTACPWLVFWLRSWLNVRRTRFQLPEHDVRFLALSLETLSKTVQAANRPEQQELIRLRMAMYDCQRAIEVSCHGLPELKKAVSIEHLLFPDHLTSVTLDDLLPLNNPTANSQQVRI